VTRSVAQPTVSLVVSLSQCSKREGSVPGGLVAHVMGRGFGPGMLPCQRADGPPVECLDGKVRSGKLSQLIQIDVSSRVSVCMVNMRLLWFAH
jgi:hypothetical protein